MREPVAVDFERLIGKVQRQSVQAERNGMST